MSMEKPESGLSAIERAKNLINQKKEERLSDEELKKQEESIRLDVLHSHIAELDQEQTKIIESESVLKKQSQEIGTKLQNQTSGMRQAMDVLKGDNETQKILEEDKSKEDLGHTERRELFTTVLGDALDERRTTKTEHKNLENELSETSREKQAIESKIEEIKKSPEGQKLLKVKEESYIEARKNEINFLSNTDNNNRYNEAYCLKKVIEYVTKNKDRIDALKNKVQEGLESVLTETNRILSAAEKSPEYKVEFGKIDFDKYKKILPQSVSDLQFSIYSYDSQRFNFPQIKNLIEEVDKDKENVRVERDKEYKLADEKKGNFFGGATKHQKQYEILKEKDEFLSKVYNSLWNLPETKIEEMLMDNITFNYHDRKTNLAETTRDYIARLRELTSGNLPGGQMPEYRQNMTIDKLFGLTSDTEVPVELQKIYDQKKDLEAISLKAKEEYELLAGKGSAAQLRVNRY